MKLEMCVASVQGARLASVLPVDRIETCIALEQGGLTPTPGFVRWIDQTFDLEQHILIRQRAGGFHYSYDEILVMRDDILAMRALDIKGVVVGALKANYELDLDALEAFHRAAGPLELTFHRAFDDVKDWKTALDHLVRLGFKRILTSGQHKNVDEGMLRLREIVEYAGGRIEIMAGGGVRPENISGIVQTGADAIHFSGTTTKLQDEASLFASETAFPDMEKTERIIAAAKG